MNPPPPARLPRRADVPPARAAGLTARNETLRTWIPKEEALDALDDVPNYIELLQGDPPGIALALNVSELDGEERIYGWESEDGTLVEAREVVGGLEGPLPWFPVRQDTPGAFMPESIGYAIKCLVLGKPMVSISGMAKEVAWLHMGVQVNS